MKCFTCQTQSAKQVFRYRFSNNYLFWAKSWVSIQIFFLPSTFYLLISVFTIKAWTTFVENDLAFWCRLKSWTISCERTTLDARALRLKARPVWARPQNKDSSPFLKMSTIKALETFSIAISFFSMQKNIQLYRGWFFKNNFSCSTWDFAADKWPTRGLFLNHYLFLLICPLTDFVLLV